MKQLSVRLAEGVKEQIDAQMLHIARDSIDRALAWDDRLQVAIAKLAETHGYAVDEDATRRSGHLVRRYVFERNYLIYFVVDEPNRSIRVINFRHVARRRQPGEP